MSLPTPGDSTAQSVFATTHWSVVLSAQASELPRSAEALESLCRAYWYPLYAYARRVGQNPSDAEDLTQGFFAVLLQKGYLKGAMQARGRFRTFLLSAFKGYMANEWDRRHAQKRGGFAVTVPIDTEGAESRIAVDPAHGLAPDVLFDRQWAMTLLERTMTLLREEYVASGRARLFEYLQSCLAKEETALSYNEISARLSLTEAAVKMAVHRLRNRYRELLRAEIAQTVSSPDEVEDELQQLFTAF